MKCRKINALQRTRELRNVERQLRSKAKLVSVRNANVISFSWLLLDRKVEIV